FDNLDAPVGEVSFDDGTKLKEAPVLLPGAKTHHVLDPGTIVPTAVEDDHLARSREVLNVALHVHLGLLAVRWGGQRHDPKHARADPLGQGTDGAAFASRIPAFKDDDDP